MKSSAQSPLLAEPLKLASRSLHRKYSPDNPKLLSKGRRRTKNRKHLSKTSLLLPRSCRPRMREANPAPAKRANREKVLAAGVDVVAAAEAVVGAVPMSASRVLRQHSRRRLRQPLRP